MVYFCIFFNNNRIANYCYLFTLFTRCVHGEAIRLTDGHWQCNCTDCYNGDSCDKLCSSHGQCNDKRCVCESGWTGAHCEMVGCPGLPVGCSGHGDCGAKLRCFCYPGWADSDCNRPVCPHDCHDRGSCTAKSDSTDTYCQCKEGYFGDACQFECIHGNVTDGRCLCQKCYSGQRCDSMCGGVGNCTAQGTCDCGFEGGRGEFCIEPGCPGLYNTDCSGHGKCLTSPAAIMGVCMCYQGWRGKGCETADCPQDCNNRGICDTQFEIPQCRNCNKGWMGVACEERCNGTQYPMNSGLCVCNDNCTHGLHCESVCNNNIGVCINDHCDCSNTATGVNPGYYGRYCEQDGCPGMFDRECNNHGQCNRNVKTCVCGDGWYGQACEKTDCPGEPDCSNNGQYNISLAT